MRVRAPLGSGGYKALLGHLSNHARPVREPQAEHAAPILLPIAAGAHVAACWDPHAGLFILGAWEVPGS